MGEIERTTCKACGMSWQYNLGCGMNHWSIENVLELFSDEVKTQVYERIKDEKNPIFNFGYRRAVCDHCKAIVGIPILNLLTENYKYIGNCQECGRGISLFEETGTKDRKILNCPLCDQQQLEVRNEGLWD